MMIFGIKMKTLGFNKLKNLRPEINEIPPPEELINSYMKLQDHNIVYVESTLESDEFIKDIYYKYIPNNQYPIRLFAPPSKYTDTHESIKKFFLEQNFIVVVINGKSKNIYLPEATLSINEFNKYIFQTKRM